MDTGLDRFNFPPQIKWSSVLGGDAREQAVEELIVSCSKTCMSKMKTQAPSPLDLLFPLNLTPPLVPGHCS
jgi:hypothetical protein